MEIDRPQLAAFLRARRQALQPEDVGLPRGARRRTAGLRREEVAVLCHMSTDYYSRLERERGPQPSEQMIASIAQGLHLTLAERDHLYRLAGHLPPERSANAEHISPGLLRIFDRLSDTPAEIVTELAETLRQTPVSVALSGNLVDLTGPQRSMLVRWFTDDATRQRYLPEERPYLSRLFASGLREVATARGPGSTAAQYVSLLSEVSPDFRRIWQTQEVGLRAESVKSFVHPEVGVLSLNCQVLIDQDSSHRLMVYTAQPGSDSYEKLQLLSVIGAQHLTG
ncbi:helix-turn-helix transcriptional regulator [Dermacoccaceae bacterium W4C1]